MRGNTFTSQQHRISFTRPDASWELRENPAQTNAVALFSNGQGRIIALLAHRALEPSNSIASPANLRQRWTQLAEDITAMGGTGETGTSMLGAEYKAADDGVTFELNYTNRAATGTQLRNWVTGMIVRDSDGRQHIYALRFAAPVDSYDAWESQFNLIAPTLRFDGERQTPFFMNSPIPWWWLAAGALAVVMIVALVRRGRQETASIPVPRTRPEPRPRTAPPADDLLSPSVSDVPDQVLIASDHAEAALDVPDQMYHQAALQGQTYDELPPPAGFWKCECGRVNSTDEQFCFRCNADRTHA